MGWLSQQKAPQRYDPTWMQRLIDNIRTAINFTSYRTCDGVPTIPPEHVGEEILDTSAQVWYKSVGLTGSDWRKLT